MHRKFLFNLSLLLVLNFLIKPIWIFWIDRGVQNDIGDGYGIYFAMFNFSMLFNILLDLGITTYNNKNIAQNAQLVTKYFSGIVVLKSLLFVVYCALTMIIGLLLGYDDMRFQFLLFITINQFLISFTQYLRSNVSALQHFTLDSVLSVLDKSLMIIFCGLLIHTNWLGIEFTLTSFIYMQTLAYALTALVVFIIVMTKTDRINLELNIPFLLAITKETFPYAILTLTMVFYYRIDAVMLDFMLPDTLGETAIYAQAYRLMDAGCQVGFLIGNMLLPMFARMIKQRENVNSLVKLSFSIIIVPALILAFTMNQYCVPIMDILYVNHAESSAPILGALMWCFVAIAATYVFGTLLTANGSVKLLNKIAITGVLLNVILNYVLIPNYMALGSAYASMITQFIVVVVQIIMCAQLFRFRINYKFLASLVVFGGVAYAVAMLTEAHMSNLAWQLIISVSVPFLVAIGIRLIDIGEIYKIVMKKEEN
ncbi:MAG: polysaccharide biosynthesis C-terminal domain-containing protein [Bacteroidetes bacterium]|nr:polysaccharide biosynthesis C-terminal domain-containing protein [Bacteroidota bacterium]